ncbi:hypothetical protein GN156_11895 [bacterium LRH843]|nr:hypothetical protein [bacterium LRH843]
MRMEYSHSSSLLVSFALLCILVTSITMIPSIQAGKLETNWQVNFVGAEETFETGQAVDVHFIVEDEFGHPIDSATVTATFDRIETVHQIEKNLHSIQSGLYETEIVFSVPGTWIAMIEVQKGERYYRNQYLFYVEGPIIAKEHRDPGDHFNLDQPLPLELKRELENIPVFKR